jgi:hypothetical protein
MNVVIVVVRNQIQIQIVMKKVHHNKRMGKKELPIFLSIVLQKQF